VATLFLIVSRLRRVLWTTPNILGSVRAFYDQKRCRGYGSLSRKMQHFVVWPPQKSLFLTRWIILWQ